MECDELMCATLANLAYVAPGCDPKKVFESLGAPHRIENVIFTETSNDAEMYTLVLPHTVVFVCRGTESVVDIGIDLMVLKTKWREIPGAKIHRGFVRQFMSLRDTIYKYVQQFAEFAEDSLKSVTFVGHSLGGALATIGAAFTKKAYPHLYVDCITFGSPRVGNRVFAEFFNSQVDHHARFVHGDDIVTKIPRINYTHVGNERRLSSAIHRGCFSRFIGNIGDHFMERYIAAIQIEQEQQGQPQEGGTEKDALLSKTA